jgi:hypothetical protein
MMKHDNPQSSFFRDDGTEINPELVTKPGLCILCRKDDNPAEEIFCILTRADQEGAAEFRCHAFEPKR